ncbi:MAG: tetratricopeptide repeat protein [Myxococcaceae bacterium]
MSTRLLSAVALLGLAACLSTPPVHQRALENNELCAQYVNAGDLEKAEVHCDLGLQFSPHYADLWSNKGIIALRREQMSVAKEHFIKAIRYNQDHAQSYNNLGYIYLKVEKSYGRAHDNFQRALKVNPDYLEARYNLALTFFYMGEKAKARKEYQTIVAINPNLADPWHDLGIMALEDGALEEAEEAFTKAVQLDPRFASAWLNLGLAFTEAGKFDKAADAYRACIEVEPNNVQCRQNLPIVNRKGALLDEGLKGERDTRLAENTPSALFELAQRYRDEGLKHEEEKAYKKCLELDGRFPACHYGLYVIFMEERRDRDARIACKNFVKFAPVDEYPQQVTTCEKYLSSSM